MSILLDMAGMGYRPDEAETDQKYIPPAEWPHVDFA